MLLAMNVGNMNAGRCENGAKIMKQKNTKDQAFNNQYLETTSEKNGGYYFDYVRINTDCVRWSGFFRQPGAGYKW
jgi:hypothetical protein